jgi:hypothetical protein
MGNSAFIFPIGGIGDRYTNLTPSPIGVGGLVVGSTFNDEGLADIVDRMMYPYQLPTFSSFSIQAIPNPLEVGDAIPASVTFLWATTNPANIQPNSLSLIDVTSGNIVLAAGLANDGSEAVIMGAPISYSGQASHVFRIIGINTQANPFQRDATYNWRHRSYYGNNVATTVVEADIEAMATNFPVTGIAGTYVFPAGGYKYICVPDALGGQINTILDGGGFAVPMAGVPQGYTNIDGGGFGYQLVSVTNAFAVVMNYRVYRTLNSLGGALTATVT